MTQPYRPGSRHCTHSSAPTWSTTSGSAALSDRTPTPTVTCCWIRGTWGTHDALSKLSGPQASRYKHYVLVKASEPLSAVRNPKGKVLGLWGHKASSSGGSSTSGTIRTATGSGWPMLILDAAASRCRSYSDAGGGSFSRRASCLWHLPGPACPVSRCAGGDTGGRHLTECSAASQNSAGTRQ